MEQQEEKQETVPEVPEATNAATTAQSEVTVAAAPRPADDRDNFQMHSRLHSLRIISRVRSPM